jgi:hypothetical protein
MREFREKVAAFISAYDSFLVHTLTHTTGNTDKERRLAELNDAQRLPYHTLRLLIGELGGHAAFLNSLNELIPNPTEDHACAQSRRPIDMMVQG